MKELEKSAEIIRRMSIDLSDIDIIKKKRGLRKEEDIDAIAKQACGFYNHIFKDELKLFLQEQIEFIAKNAVSVEQLQFARGTFNGLCLIREWFERECRKSSEEIPNEEAPEIPTGLE